VHRTRIATTRYGDVWLYEALVFGGERASVKWQLGSAAGLTRPHPCPILGCLLILAHPRRNSLCGALCDALGEGARQAGVGYRELILSEMRRFDPNVHADSAEHHPLEPDLVLAQRVSHLAEHLVFVYPTG
jgi:hypothetical protein